MSTIVIGPATDRWGRYRLASAALALGAVAGGLALAAGWPYWRAEPAAAAVNAFVTGAFVTSGILLASLAALRRTGLLAIAAGLCWAATWLLCREVGPLPAIGLFANALFFVVLGWGVLLYPDGRLTGRADWWAAMATTVAFGLLAVVAIIVAEPEWNGFAPEVRWPSLLSDEAVFGFVSDLYTVVNPVLAVVFVGLLVRRCARLYGLERSLIAPALAVLGVVVLCLAALSPTLENHRPGHVADGIAAQGAALAVFPLALLVAMVRRAVAAATAADRMLRLGGGPATVGAVRDALRSVLRDGTVDVFFWLPEEHRFVDVDGEAADPDGRPQAWRQEVTATSGERLAVVTGGPLLRRHAPFTEAALRAARLALQNAQLQVAIQAQLVETRAAQRRVEDAEAAERNRIARDLHDGVQQRLLALAMSASAAEWSTDDDPDSTASVFRDIRAGLLAANAEVRNVARGLDPEILRTAGLAGAVRDAAGRPGLPVDLRVELTGTAPYGDLAERTVYFAVCEALANAVKHSGAGAVWVRLTGGEARLEAEVRDDGCGGAAAGTAGGLAGLRDRVDAAGGSMLLTSPPGAGTTVLVSVPVGGAR
ncbi:sensor histidine kinase [Parafrankia sp. BMG5.11]|uniref:sensor histidine kinase n=1 Tax=Parafrankia sp. BMG5.11 TaxID=222540 RepID=UPI00103EE260|nr:histidine kinase [Parafrankia sp. BMG5.11]TCJ32823.1 sensor histidine kinase [Parafrankia sp. BMG5.11]